MHDQITMGSAMFSQKLSAVSVFALWQADPNGRQDNPSQDNSQTLERACCAFPGASTRVQRPKPPRNQPRFSNPLPVLRLRYGFTILRLRSAGQPFPAPSE